MKKLSFIRNSAGTTIVELIIALFISSLIVAGLYRVIRSVMTISERERQKAEMIRSIMTVNNILERDVRMAGCGLPGNGLRTVLFEEHNDQLILFSNEERIQTTLGKEAKANDMQITVASAEGFKEDEWVCVASSVDTVYREIRSIKDNNVGLDTIYLNFPMLSPGTMVSGSNVYAADCIYYWAASDPRPVLKRKKNDMTVELGTHLAKIAVVPKKSNGTIVPLARDADVITVVLGGYVGTGNNRVLLADSTEVNIRN